MRDDWQRALINEDPIEIMSALKLLINAETAIINDEQYFPDRQRERFYNYIKQAIEKISALDNEARKKNKLAIGEALKVFEKILKRIGKIIDLRFC
jgi:hypothetical protein